MAPAAAMASLARRLARDLLRDGATGCWLYVGRNIHPSGYVRAMVGGIPTTGPRAAWYFAEGRWPAGRLYRQCGQPRCCSPLHYREGRPTGKHPRELRPPRAPRFDAATIREIRRLRARGRPYREIAEQYGCSISTVFYFVKK